jgi:hypothetical protein
MSEVPRRPLLQSVPASLAGTALAGSTLAAADGRPVPDGGQSPAPGGAGASDPERTAVRTITREQSGTVPPNGRDRTVVTAPPGSLLELQAVAVSVDPVDPANAGHHAVSVGPADAGVVLLRGVADDDRPLRFDGTGWRAANREAVPADGSAQALAARGHLLDDETGLAVEYRNGTNSVQESPRRVELWAVEHAPPSDAGAATAD